MPHPVWQQLVGKPFRDGGRGPTHYDCLGLSIEYNKLRGIEVVDPRVSGATARGEFSKRWSESWEPVTNPRVGDLVLAKTTVDGAETWHTLVIVEPRLVLHTTVATGSITQSFDAFLRRGRVVSYWRPLPKGVTKDRRLDLEPAEVPGIAPASLAESLEITTAAATALSIGINIAFSVIVSLVSTLISQVKKPKKQKGDENRPAFDLGGPRNTTQPGTPIPIGYGEHPAGGQIVALFQRSDADYRSRLYMLIVVSEGPVESIAGFTSDVDNQPATTIPGSLLTINGNPINGYPGCRVWVRLGGLTQSIIPGFEETVVSGTVGSELHRTAIPGNDTTTIPENADTIAYTTSTEIDAFEVQVQFPNGLYKTNATGDVELYQWHGTLRYYPVGNVGAQVAVFVEFGPSIMKTTHTRSFRVSGLTRGIYRISLTRSSLEDTNTQRRVSQSIWTTVNEIDSRGAVAYVGRAVLGIVATASDQLSGGVPNVACILKGKKVWVWDGVSTTSPSFTRQYSSNPAWVALDVMLAKRYGQGARTPLNRIPLQELKDWADYCDETVVTSGISHSRWSFNHYFDNVQSTGDVLSQIAAAGRASIFPDGSEYHVVVAKARTYSQVFGMGSILPGTMRRMITDPTDRPTVVQLFYLNKEANYDQDVAELPVSSTPVTKTIKDQLKIVGLTDPRQAYRAVKWATNVTRLRESISFDVPIEGLSTEVGGICRVAHLRLGMGGRSGRVVAEGSDLTHLILDVDLDVPLSFSWTILVRCTNLVTGAESFVSRTLVSATYAAGNEVEVTVPFDADLVPGYGAAWIAGPSSEYYVEYETLRTKLNPDLTCSIEAIEYDETTYEDDPGHIETFTPAFPSSSLIPSNPTNLSVSEEVGTFKDGTIHHRILVTFTPTLPSATYDVWTRFATPDTDETNAPVKDTDWRHAGTTRDGQLQVDINVSWKRVVEVSVTPRGNRGQATDPRYGSRSSTALQGKTDGSGAPTGLVAVVVGDMIALTWTPPSDRDVYRYELRAASSSLRWLLAQVVLPSAQRQIAVFFPVLYGIAHYLNLKAVSTSEVQGDTPGSLAITPSKSEVFLVGDTAVTGASWTSGSTTSNFTLTGGFLRSDLGASPASWQCSNTAFPILSKRARIHAFLDAVGYDLVSTGATLGVRNYSTYARRMLSGGEIVDVPWPDQVVRPNDIDSVVGGPLLTVIPSGAEPYDWATNWKVLLEYDLASDASATVWDGWKTWQGPFETQGRYYVRWRVTVTIANLMYQVDLQNFYCQVVALGERAQTFLDQLDMVDDFANSSNEGGEIGTTGMTLSQVGTAATATMATGEAGHPGMVLITTSAVNGESCSLNSGSVFHFLPKASTYFRKRVALKIVSTTSVDFLVGLSNSVTSAAPTRGIYFESKSGGSWNGITKDGSGTTTNGTSVALAAGWFHFTIEVFGLTTVKFTIEDDARTVLGTATNVANIEADTVLGIVWMITPRTNATKTMNVDRYRMRATGLER